MAGLAAVFFGTRLPSNGLLLVGAAAVVGAVAMFIIARVMPQLNATADPPTPARNAYSEGILPRYTYVSDGLVIVEGNADHLGRPVQAQVR